MSTKLHLTEQDLQLVKIVLIRYRNILSFRDDFFGKPVNSQLFKDVQTLLDKLGGKKQRSFWSRLWRGY